MRANRVRFIADDPAETLRSLRSEPGRGIWLVGGGEIVRECLDSGQVGEVIISLVPVLLGDGVPLFLPRAGTTWLNLRGTRGLANGVVQLTYDMRARRKIEPLEDAPVEMRLRDQRSREAAAAVGAGMVRSWSVRASAA
jgi:dihydrofolate reductase